nr:IS3 family transposase [Hymenobacter siberiensis]
MARNSYAPPPGGGRGGLQPADAELVARLRALVQRHGGWGFWKYYYRLRKLRVVVNHKRVWRIYQLLNLQLVVKKH